MMKAVEGIQRVAHKALVRVQTRTDDEALLSRKNELEGARIHT